MLSSGGLLNEILTTSGIIVEDNYDCKYLTLATHGFPLGRESVYQPNRNSARPGSVHDRITDSDIALLRISSSQSFRNETFAAKFLDGTNILPQTIKAIIDPLDLHSYDEVTMNNPFSGFCIGVHIGVQRTKIPSDDPVAERRWVTSDWSYFGNGLDRPMDGCCGSPILD